ncbi:MAG: hypothetical protein ACI39E_02410 [Acutalibacteraceae bacterium]
MNQPSLSSAQLQALLQYASARLGVPPDELAKTVTNGGYDGLAASLSPENQKKLQALVGDRSRADALFNSPAVQAFLSRFHSTQNE